MKNHWTKGKASFEDRFIERMDRSLGKTEKRKPRRPRVQILRPKQDEEKAA